ncbi:MAG: B12-binding domain-containing radical SAM protein [Candidatus Omnitrophica bacterium]|nr:B12-binding domain-containing radical SAM protein [Candidatus Omnitrophota bacterium]
MSRGGRVLLIIHDVYQEDNIFPLGPAYIASALKASGAEVTVACQDVFHYSNEELVRRYLQNGSYDLIGVGFMAARFKETVLDLCEVINQYKGGAWLVLGAHGPSSIPEYMIKTTGADIVAIGDAEETMVDLLKCKIAGGNDISNVDGIAFRSGDGVVVNKRREPSRQLDRFPFPAWEIFPMKDYADCVGLKGMEEGGKVLAVITGRGCTNRCNFCYRMESGIRLRSINNVIEEMKILYQQYGVRHFNMQDELFISSRRRLLEFRDALKSAGLKITFNCDARVDIFDEEIAHTLAECGCVFLNFGLESSDQNVLNAMGKRTTVEQNIKAVRIAKKTGVGIGLNFLWGNIGDTEASLKSNVRLIRELNTYYHLRTIRPVTPYPGCDLYYEAIRRGLLSGPEDFFERFKNSDLLTVNFTDIPEKQFYESLFNVNKELIIDHYEHTAGDMKEANHLIEQFYNLYFKGEYKFRGARHYDRKQEKVGGRK